MAKVKTFSKYRFKWDDELKALDKAANDFIEQNNIGKIISVSDTAVYYGVAVRLICVVAYEQIINQLKKEANYMLTRLVIIIFLQAFIGYFMVPGTFADEIDAQELYKKHCVLCHGEDGKGKTDLGEGLGARDFTEKKFQVSITDEKILEQIENGAKEKMFPFKDKLTAEEMKALVPVIRAFGG